MKTLKNGLLVLGFLVSAFLFRPAVSPAHGAEHSKADIQMLRDAAAALKASNPDLADKLSQYSDREEKEVTEEETEEHEKS